MGRGMHRDTTGFAARDPRGGKSVARTIDIVVGTSQSQKDRATSVTTIHPENRFDNPRLAHLSPRPIEVVWNGRNKAGG